MTHDSDTSQSPAEPLEPPISSADFAPESDESEHEAHKRPPQRGDAMLNALNVAIELYPDAAANYAARGDFLWQRRQWALALADYQQALALAERDLAENRWGFVAQALRDSLLMRLREMGEAV